MKKILVILISLFFMPVIVSAETLTFNVCEYGCEYKRLRDIYHHTELFQDNHYDVILNFNDHEIYELNDFTINFEEDKISSLTINGNSATLNISQDFDVKNINNIAIYNLNVSCYGFDIQNFNNIVMDNVKITDEWFSLQGKEIQLNGSDDYNNRAWLNTKAVIKNSSIKPKNEKYSQVIFALLSGEIINTEIENLLIVELADISIKSSKLIEIIILPGFMIPIGSNIYIDSYTQFTNPIVRKELSKEIIDAQGNDAIFNSGSGSLLEFDRSLYNASALKDAGISPELLSNIYYYQVVNKTIKKDINISEFEVDFKNTYENSEGYDDIKDLPIEWKSENESIARIDNGIIIPVSNGQVDLVGTRGNDIYTIHLTVDTLTSKEIKIPISGIKIKLWVLIVSGLLFVAVGVCTYVLLKNKKAE